MNSAHFNPHERLDDVFSIMTSASEYVTGYEADVVSTVSDVNQARRYSYTEAKQVLAKIKAKHDNGAEVFRNPKGRS